MTDMLAQIEAVPPFLWLFVVLALSGIGFAAQRWLNRPANRHRRESLKLFYELCHAHRLDSRAIRILMGLIRGHQLEHPAIIFLRPDLFLADKVPTQLKPRLDDIKKLRRQLFVQKSAS